MSLDKYVKAAVMDVVEDLEKQGLKLKGKAYHPYEAGYHPEMDMTPELNEAGVAMFQGFIGTFQWMIEPGRVDILTKVLQLSCFQAMPWEGHLEACYSILVYLHKHPTISLFFHPSCINIQQDHFKSQDWTDFYGDGVEELPPDMPELLDEAVKVTAFVDSNHAGNLVTQRLQTRYRLFCNPSPITCSSKKQNRVEASTFGAELIAACTCLEAVASLCFKLRMFGITVVWMDPPMFSATTIALSTIPRDQSLS